MSDDYLIIGEDTGFDRVLAFLVPDRNARGRLVRLGPTLDEVLSAHAYPPAAKRVLAEALVLTALIGGLLKDEQSQLTMQAQSEGGPIDLLVCDYRQGELRGYLRHDEEALAALGDRPNLRDLFGSGYLCVTIDLGATAERYQGIVPLEGACLAQACEAYFAQSEQLPTLIRVAIRPGDGNCVAGGLLMQHIPEGEEGRERLHAKADHPEWDHVAAMAGSIRDEELLETELGLEEVVWRLFHEEREVRVEQLRPLQRGCRCTVEHYRTILQRFPEDELSEMKDDDGLIPVDCAFCSKILRVDV